MGLAACFPNRHGGLRQVGHVAAGLGYHSLPAQGYYADKDIAPISLRLLARLRSTHSFVLALCGLFVARGGLEDRPACRPHPVLGLAASRLRKANAAHVARMCLAARPPMNTTPFPIATRLLI